MTRLFVSIVFIINCSLANCCAAQSFEEAEAIETLIISKNYEELNELLVKRFPDYKLAPFLLGVSFKHGRGLKKDLETAAELLLEGWKQGVSESGAAYCNLIVLNTEDVNKYLQCLDRVVQTGNNSAKNMMALTLLTHPEVKPTLSRTYDPWDLLLDAYKNGSGSASYSLFYLLTDNQTRAEYTARDIAFLEGAALGRWPDAIYLGYEARAHANVLLARAYLQGNGVPSNASLYVKFLRRASKLESADAACLLGEAFTLGLGVEQNFDEATRYLNLAEQRGCKLSEKYFMKLRSYEAQVMDFEYYTPEPTFTFESDLSNSLTTYSKPSTLDNISAFESLSDDNESNSVDRQSLIVTRRGSTCRQSGSFTHCSDGSWSKSIGNNVFMSEGTIFQKVGNTYFGSDRSSYQMLSNGTVIGPNGTSCQTVGTLTICN